MAYLLGDYMAARKKQVRQITKAQLSPAQQIMMEILESAQVVIVAIFCIGIVCIATYAIAMVIIGVFVGPDMGKLGGLALSTIAGIAGFYIIITNKNVQGYLSSIRKKNEKK